MFWDVYFRYIKGEDLANLFTVDPETGQINTSTLLDRESNFVDDGLYVITINAVDNGMFKEIK